MSLVKSDAIISKRSERYLTFDGWNSAYLDWQFEQFRPYVGNRILEVGCGVGGITEKISATSMIHSLDIDSKVLELARSRFPSRPDNQFELLDISTCSEEDLEPLKERMFDTIICINVLEHIENDLVAIQRMEQLLIPGGNLLLLVPAHRWLYGEYDRLDGHFRRYTRSSFKNLVAKTSFSFQKLYYFNLIGALGWWTHYKLLKHKIHGQSQFSVMTKLLPIVRKLERCVRPPFGLSLVSILNRPE